MTLTPPDPPAGAAGARTRGTPLRLARWLALLSLLVPATAEAARITGRIDGYRNLLNPVWADARDPKNHGYSFREPVPTVRPEFRRLFPHAPKEICVAAISAAPQKAGGPIEIRVGGGRTTPVTIVVAPGTLLRFQNTDAFKHRLYGVNIKTFPAADTKRGDKREWTVPEPGIFEIRDELAPSLRTWVVADPNVAAIVYPSQKGEFSLTVPEAGDYTVQAFFAGKKVGPAVPVTVATADIDISRNPLKVGDEKAAAAADKAEAAREKAEKEEAAKAGGEKK
jgi:plastocyanin